MKNSICVTTSEKIKLLINSDAPYDKEDLSLLKNDIIHIQSVIEYALLQQGICGSELTMVCVTSQEMQLYNKIHRGIEGVTDVLSFVSYIGDDEENVFLSEGQKYLGDSLLCCSYVKKQAKEYNQSYMQELTRVVIHSVLHLLGYVHDTYDFSAEPMLQRQEYILRKYSEMAGIF